jgi:carbamoyltransferase
MIVIGISAYYHDSACALVRNGVIVAAAQEERFSRRKHDPEFPLQALLFCLAEAGVRADEVDYVAFYDKPFLKFERLLETYLSFAPRGLSSFRLALPIWLREKLFLKSLLAKELKAVSAHCDWEAKLLFGEHHVSHAASAYYPSPFDQAAVLTLDGVGEWATTSLAIGRGNTLEVIKEIHFPHSLGLLYSAFTYHLGFKVNSGEYKVMGLAPYGEPLFVQRIIENLIDIKPDGSFRLNMDYFDYCTGLSMTNHRFSKLFGVKPRQPEQLLTQIHMDLAASLQVVTEQVLSKLAAGIACETGLKNLCLAGGVALNCVANGKLLRDGHFDHIWVLHWQPITAFSNCRALYVAGVTICTAPIWEIISSRTTSKHACLLPARYLR